MSDLLAGLASVLLDGPILVLLLAVWSLMLGGICYWAGVRAALRKVDAGRDVVVAACERAARTHVAVPEQRASEQ